SLARHGRLRRGGRRVLGLLGPHRARWSPRRLREAVLQTHGSVRLDAGWGERYRPAAVRGADRWSRDGARESVPRPGGDARGALWTGRASAGQLLAGRRGPAPVRLLAGSGSGGRRAGTAAVIRGSRRLYQGALVLPDRRSARAATCRATTHRRVFRSPTGPGHLPSAN